VSTNLAWICTCPESTEQRIKTESFTAISPHGRCRDCGRSYDEANGTLESNLEGISEYLQDLLRRAKDLGFGRER
jgi:transposase-like protein